jgi:fructose-bisphosphate aldolase class 1
MLEGTIESLSEYISFILYKRYVSPKIGRKRMMIRLLKENGIKPAIKVRKDARMLSRCSPLLRRRGEETVLTKMYSQA